MKNSRITLVITMLVICSMAIFGCSKNEETSGDKTTPEPTKAVEATTAPQPTEEPSSYVVTFFDADGTTVLSTQEVAVGETATEYTPEKENQTFMGWFATPSLTHDFDFTAPITADTSVFAGFAENVVDTRTYAVVGSGTSPLLSQSSWGNVINEEHYMTKSVDANVYTITMDINEGDEFQFAIDSTWADQRGGGYLTGTGLDGTEYFSVSGGLSDSSKKSNIKCLVAGNYTLTLNTHPGSEALDTIEWTYNGDVVSEQVEFDTTYYIKGAIVTEWQDKYDDMYAFVEADGIHTLTIDLEEGDEFLLTTLVSSGDTQSVGSEYVRYSNITDETSLTYVDGTESFNIVTRQKGTYTFTYNPETTELLVDFVAN